MQAGEEPSATEWRLQSGYQDAWLKKCGVWRPQNANDTGQGLIHLRRKTQNTLWPYYTDDVSK